MEGREEKESEHKSISTGTRRGSKRLKFLCSPKNGNWPAAILGSVPVSWLFCISSVTKTGLAPKFSGSPLSLLLAICRDFRLGNSKRLEGTVPVSALSDTINHSVMQGEGTMCGGDMREGGTNTNR